MNSLDYFDPSCDVEIMGTTSRGGTAADRDHDHDHDHEPHLDSDSAWKAVIRSASTYNVHAESWFTECTKWADEALRNSVEIDPDRKGGIPVLRGTRFTVGQTLAELAHSAGVPEVAENFDLDEETIRQMLYGLSLLAERPRS